MAAGTYNISMEQGAWLSLTFAFTDENGDAIPLTGFSKYMQARTEQGGDLILDMAAYLIIDEPGGIVTLDVPDTVTAGVTTSGCYDMVLKSPDNRLTRELQGSFTVSRRATIVT